MSANGEPAPVPDGGFDKPEGLSEGLIDVGADYPEGHDYRYIDIAFSRDGRFVVTSAHAPNFGEIRIWSLPDFKLLKRLKPQGSGHEVCVTPDGKMVISGGWRRILEFWDIESGNPSEGKLMELGVQSICKSKKSG